MRTPRIALLLLIVATFHATAAPERAFIKAPDASVGDYFGHSVAMDGDTMVVGASRRDASRGAAYVYVRSGSSWTLQATLTNPNGAISDQFGHSVAISGDSIVVGSHGTRVDGVGELEGETQYGAGSAHVFVRQAGLWSEEASLTSSYPDFFDRFGWTVAISGDVIVVGAFQEDSDGIAGEETDDATSAGAAYVFENGPGGWQQTAFLKASNAAAFDSFGRAVAADGDTIVVGAYREDGNGIDGETDNSKGSSGAVYVFGRNGEAWEQTDYLKASDADFSDEFGGAVSIDGDILAVGARYRNSVDGGGNTDYDSGRAYIFEKTGGDWLQTASLGASNEDHGDQFGYSVAVSGDRLIVGSRLEDGSGLSDGGTVRNTGAAYVFEKGAGGWLETDYLKASNAGANDEFGWSVAAAGDFVAAGAFYEDSDASGGDGLLGSELEVSSGAVYVFEPGAPAGPEISVGLSGSVVRSGDYIDTFGVACVDGLTFQRTFSIHNLGDANLTGIAAGIAGIGAGEFTIDVAGLPSTLEPGESGEFFVAYVPAGAGDTSPASVEITSNDSDEATYLVHLAGFGSPLQWLESGEVTPAGSPVEGFGRSMAIDGDTLVVGVPLEELFANDGPGLVYVFEKVAGEWIERAILSASNAADNDAFGISVAIDGDVIVVGAIEEGGNGVDGPADNSLNDSGAAYIFERQGESWVETAYLKASNPDSFDEFGHTVAVSGGIVAVASVRESSDGSGVGADNEFTSAGAVYLFEKQGGDWVQQQFLKNSPAEKFAEFGSALLLSGDRLFVGSRRASEEGVADGGAVFEFSLTGGTWIPAGVIRGSNTEVRDYFGASLALSGDTLVVGADEEDSDPALGPADNSIVVAGAVYVFVEDGGSWTEQAMLKAPFADDYDHFGSSVALVGDRLLVGAPREDGDGVRGASNNGNPAAGAVYEFIRSAGTWTQNSYLKSSDTDNTGELGSTVLLAGNEALLGASESQKILRYDLELPIEPSLLLSTDDGIEIGNGETLDFGLTRICSSNQRVLTINNGGRLPLSELAFEIIGADEGFYPQLLTGCLEGAESSTWTLEFSPPTTGPKNVVLRISGRSLASPFEVNLSGTGIELLQVAQEAYLKASNSGDADFFGYSSAVDGDTVVIGAYEADGGPRRSGAVYVFVRRGGSWFQEACLKASNPGISDRFGFDVDISRDTIVVGAPDRDLGRGAVYVFERTAGSWVEEAFVRASNADFQDLFGHSVAIDADTMVVGAIYEDGEVGNRANDSGAAYVFVRDGAEWEEQAYLKSPNLAPRAYFGQTVSVSGERVAIGALGARVEARVELGSVYVFVREDVSWNLEAQVVAPERTELSSFDEFGFSCEIDQDRLVVGAPGYGRGRVFVFQSVGDEWVQQDVLSASNPGSGDEFGYSVGLSGDRIVVGDNREASDAIGIGGAQLNNLANDSGAAYLFEKLSDKWVQSSYIKASNTGTNDRFGASVALSGGILVAGADFEDSDARGVNGDQLNDRSSASGAAYIFGIGGVLGEALFEAAATSAGLLGDATLPASQPFGDSVDNLTKYAFNLDLSKADSHLMEPGGTSGLPLVEIVEDPEGLALRVVFLHRLDSGLIYVPRMSEDLSSGSWTSLQGPPEVTPIDAEWERVVYLQPLSDPLPEQLFGRVEVFLLEGIEKPSIE